MERWTKRTADGVLLSEDHEEKYTPIELIDILLEHLAAYEDTGYSPADFDRLCKGMDETMRTATELMAFERLNELAQADKDGRLVVLPCKVGDMLWPICFDTVLGAWVVDDKPERVNEVGTKGFFVSATYGDPEAIDEFHPYEEIGDVYFWSHEEAVNAAAAKERPEEVRDDA